MTRTYLNDDEAGPVWAVFGAPLVGVPLMVAVLALGSGGAVDSAVEPEAGFAVEQVEMPDAAQESDADALRSD
ncbi:MAG TPA: hypothetical protein VMM35_03690 [Longimicrobiales bacterium]|nr:hypothetical protein [Longimicrobiales bacterium]